MPAAARYAVLKVAHQVLSVSFGTDAHLPPNPKSFLAAILILKKITY